MGAGRALPGRGAGEWAGPAGWKLPHLLNLPFSGGNAGIHGSTPVPKTLPGKEQEAERGGPPVPVPAQRLRKAARSPGFRPRGLGTRGIDGRGGACAAVAAAPGRGRGSVARAGACPLDGSQESVSRGPGADRNKLPGQNRNPEPQLAVTRQLESRRAVHRRSPPRRPAHAQSPSARLQPWRKSNGRMGGSRLRQGAARVLGVAE